MKMAPIAFLFSLAVFVDWCVYLLVYDQIN